MRHVVLTAALAVAAGCETVAPALTSLLVAFGQDLLAATAVNYTPRYAVELENLLTVLARQATGLELQGQLVSSGYQPPPPSHARNDPYGSGGAYGGQPGYGQNDDYGDTGTYEGTSGYETPAYGETGYDSSGYDSSGYDQSGYDTSGYGQSVGYGAQSVSSYGAASYTGGYTPPADTAYQDPYAASRGRLRTRSADAAPISLGVALLARRAGSDAIEAIEDGATLQDGRGDPGRGDLLRVHFQANCACWIYVVGVDATGYVAQIFPDPDSPLTNPVTAGANYLMPGGDEWWGLDENRGIEQIYFVAARGPRPDIEQALARLAGQPRIPAVAQPKPVREPAIIPSTRGLVKVAAPAAVEVPMGAQQPARVTPAIFSNGDDGTDLVITRWFRHE